MREEACHAHRGADYGFHGTPTIITINFHLHEQAYSKIHIKIQGTLNRQNNFDK